MISKDPLYTAESLIAAIAEQLPTHEEWYSAADFMQATADLIDWFGYNNMRPHKYNSDPKRTPAHSPPPDDSHIQAIKHAWDWASTHMAYAAPEVWPTAAWEGLRHLDRTINGDDQPKD